MRLADFILANIEPILVEWEAFARTVWPSKKTTPLSLRDHALAILQATAWDMKSAQTAVQQSDKSKGSGDAGTESVRVDSASLVHAVDRVRSGFDLLAMVAEYRALRASVIRLWRKSHPDAHLSDVDDLTRFNESIDQSLTEAIRSYTERVDRSRQMFLAILGHDLRGPLNAITMSAQVLAQTSKLDDDATVIVSGIATAVTAMARMIGDLLDFTNAGLDSAMPVISLPMDLKNLCQEVVGEMQAGNPKCTIHFEAEGDLKGEWDTDRLRQVIANLLGNAVQHGAKNGDVDFSVTGEASGVILVIRNGGPPIPSNSLATIFDPLVRLESPDTQKKRRPGSIGLGLFIAREVVTAHGGAIDVQSSLEKGTVFTVRLPRKGLAHSADRQAGN